MWYMIFAQDHENSLDARLKARPEHLARLQRLLQQGHLLLAGPMPSIDSPDPGPAGFSGSVIVAEFETLEHAQQWADADPYMAAGVYRKVDVRPFIKVLP